MPDFYRNGFDDGYGNKRYGDDYPRSDMDAYSYRRGMEDGQRRANVRAELRREDDYFNAD